MADRTCRAEKVRLHAGAAKNFATLAVLLRRACRGRGGEMPTTERRQTEITRCVWARGDALMERYHDTEWGRPVRDSRELFEKLMLDGFQAGLSWRTILHRRETLRGAFASFRPEQMARFDQSDRERLMQDPGIIRNRRKVESAITNAQAYLRLCDQGVSFSEFLWAFSTDFPPTARKRGAAAPTESEASRAMARGLKKAGFAFCGPTICYAFMQAVGMVVDHEPQCFLRASSKR